MPVQAWLLSAAVCAVTARAMHELRNGRRKTGIDFAFSAFSRKTFVSH
jgi:hypothetical protein